MTAFAVTAFAIANIGLMVTEFGGIATAFDLFGVSRYLSVPIAAVAIWSLVLFGSYRYAERVFLLLTVVFIAYPIAAILGHPNWHQVAANTLWPHFIASKSFLLLVGRAHRHHHHPVHPAVRSGRGGGQGRQARGVQVPAGRRHRGGDPGRVRRHVDHRRHRRHHRRVGAPDLGLPCRPRAAPGGRAGRRGAVRAGPPGGLGAGRRRRAPLDLLCRGRGGRGRAVGVVQLPPGPPLPGPVHRRRSWSGRRWSWCRAT